MAWIDQRGSVGLPRNECLRLLALHAGGVGRVAAVVDGRPVVVPVNYGVLGDEVVLQIGRGTMLEMVDRGSVLAFEIDGVQPQEAWSVYLRGPARRAGPSDMASAHAPGNAVLVPEPGPVTVLVRGDVVSGRRFAVRPEAWRAMCGQSRDLGALPWREPVRVPGNATIRETASAMDAGHVTSVVLGDGPMWLVSEHDLVGAVAAGLGGGAAARDVVACAPLWVTTSSTVEDAAALMTRHGAAHVLVITAQGQLVGVLSRTEAFCRLLEERDQRPWSTMTSAAAIDAA